MDAPTQTNVSTTDISGAVHAFAPSNFTVIPARMFDDPHVAKSSAHQAAHLSMRAPRPSRQFRLTIILCEDLCSLTGWLCSRDTSLHRSALERSK